MKKYKRYLDKVDRLRSFVRKTSVSSRRRVVAVTTLLFVMLIISIDISPFGYRIQAGKPSPRDIVAPTTLQYIDENKTEEQRKAAAEAVPEVYVRDEEVTGKVLNNLEELFGSIERYAAMELTIKEKAERLAGLSGVGISEAEAERLLSMSTGQIASVHDASLEIIRRIMDENVTSKDLEETVAEAEGIAGELSEDPSVKEMSSIITRSYVKPNSVIDSKETEKRREAAREAVTAVITTRLEGELILAKDDVVTAEQVALLKSLGFKEPSFLPVNFLYVGAFAIILMGAVWMFMAKERRFVYESPGLLALMGVMVILYTVVAKALSIATGYLSPSWGYMMPVALVAIITAVMTDYATSLMIVMTCAMITGLVSGGNFSLAAFVLLGGFFPALMVSRKSNRHDLRWAGVYTSLWIALVALGISAATQFRQGLLLNTAVGFTNGIICIIVAMGLLPFLETTFRVTTNTWLLELASPEQALLKELSIKAPGTYSHSVMVANLSEAAAREVGSYPMLARIASYYHDVGKLKRPQFFIENQSGNSSPHDRISPNLSKLVITSHVKDGVEMLRKQHMPPDIVDIIEQHHGTSVVRYFYDRALEAAEGEPVDINTFRYQFPKPKSKTAGILLLADSVEATARTVDRPSSKSIEQMVDRVIEGKIADGQLDDSGLTLSDIRKIKGVFSKILISAYHPRIDYPKARSITGGGVQVARKSNQRDTGINVEDSLT